MPFEQSPSPTSLPSNRLAVRRSLPICSASSLAVTFPFVKASLTAASSYSPKEAIASGETLSSSASLLLTVRATMLFSSVSWTFVPPGSV